MDLAKKLEDMRSLYQEIEALGLELDSRRKRQQLTQKRQPYSMSFWAQGQPSNQNWKLMDATRLTTLPPIQEEGYGYVNVDHRHRDRGKRTAEIDCARLTAFLDYDDSFLSPWNWRPNGRGRGSEFRHGSSKTASFLDDNNSPVLPYWNYYRTNKP